MAEDWSSFNFNPMYEAPQDSFDTPQTFQLPTMSQNVGANLQPSLGYDNTPGPMSYAPADNMTRVGETYEPGFYDKLQDAWRNVDLDPSSKTGMDNLFRVGQAGVGGLGAFLQMQENKKAREAQANALQFMQSQMGNPFEGQLRSMIDNPSGYLNDPVDQAMTARAEESALRARTKAGRSGLGYEDQLNLQGLRQKSYQNRLQTLANLFQQARQGNQAAASTIAQIMSKAPQGNFKPIIGGLGAVFGAGKDIAYKSGITDDPYTELRK